MASDVPGWKIVLFGWALAMIPTAIALIPTTALWWYFEVRNGAGWVSFDLLANLKWAVVFFTLWMVTYKGLEVMAGHVLTHHRGRLDALGDWLDRWYW